MAAEETGLGRWVPRWITVLRWGLWAVLLAAVVAVLGGSPPLGGIAGGRRLPDALAALPPLLVALFVVGYAVYRFALVRAGRYPAGKAMVQIVLMSLVLALVVSWAGERRPATAVGAPVDLSRALASREADVRALAVEVLRGRPRAEGLRHGERLVALLSDPSTEVRRQAHATLVALAGRDLGAGPAAADAWRAALAEPR